MANFKKLLEAEPGVVNVQPPKPNDKVGPGPKKPKTGQVKPPAPGNIKEDFLQELSVRALKNFVKVSRKSIIDAHKQNKESEPRTEKLVAGIRKAEAKIKDHTFTPHDLEKLPHNNNK